MKMLRTAARWICGAICLTIACLAYLVEQACVSRQKDESNQRCQALIVHVNACTAKIEELNDLVQNLQRSKQELESKAEIIQRQLRKELEGNGSYADGAATPFVLESTVKTVQTQISGLSKVVFGRVKLFFPDPDLSLVAHFRGAYLSRPAHVSYMVKAWLCEIFFRDFENESFQSGGGTICLEVSKRSKMSFEYFSQITKTAVSCRELLGDGVFHAFCLTKLRDYQTFLGLSLIADPNGGAQPPSTIDDKVNLIELLDANDTGRLIESFVSAARNVWALHKLCLSFEQRAEIFRVQPGTEFVEEYMDGVVSRHDDYNLLSQVGFMISPGFRLRKSIVKSQVYLAGMMGPNVPYLGRFLPPPSNDCGQCQ